MRDPRLEKLAKTLLEYSNKVEAGQHVLIKGNILAKPLIKELIKHTYRIGAYPHTEILDDEIEKLIQERQDARKNKDFKRADEIRDLLLQKGIVLEDTREGVRWKRA